MTTSQGSAREVRRKQEQPSSFLVLTCESILVQPAVAFEAPPVEWDASADFLKASAGEIPYIFRCTRFLLKARARRSVDKRHVHCPSKCQGLHVACGQT